MKPMPWIFTLLIIVLPLYFGEHLLASAPDSVKVFSLQRPDNNPAQHLPELEDPELYGMSWRFKWMTIESNENRFNWELIDKAVEVTGRAKKKVMLRVTAGINSPEWVYQAGAKPLEFRNTDLAHPKSHPEQLRMPIPWDEVYLTKWESFIHAFGKRYNGNPNIYSIQITGGGYIGEMNLPKAHQKWQRAGYTDEKLITAWKRIIDAYQKAFPNTPTNLDINEPLGKQSNVLQPVVDYALATYPRKLYLQHNGLKAVFPRNNRIRQILRDASAKTNVGYQMVGGKGFLDAQTGNRGQAFRNALEDRVSYVEVYASDVRDPAQRRARQFLSNPIERR